MQSKAATPAEYIDSLQVDRKHAISEIRRVILKHLPQGFSEVMCYGMIGYVVPHSLYPPGYHCNPKQPLPFINLASQKNYISLYHMALYGPLLDWFKKEWKTVSRNKLDMGKCCVRFKSLEDVPLDLIGRLAARITPRQWVAMYEKYRNSSDGPPKADTA
jgi:hypothetical protein